MPTKEWAAKRRREYREWLDAYKVERGCVDCGFVQNPESLQFDHRPGTVKRFSIGMAANRSRESVLEEIAKCDIRCGNCHAIASSGRAQHGRGNARTHGRAALERDLRSIADQLEGLAPPSPREVAVHLRRIAAESSTYRSGH